MPSRAGPYFFEEIGERTPGAVPLDPRGGKSFFPPHPFSPGWSMSGDLLLSAYLACGLHIERPVTARPPAGRAGDGDRYPLGKGGEKPFRFPLFPPVNEPLLPPARAGGRAMRRWSWRPQARPLPDQPPSPIPPTREWGSKGKEPPSPWCSFPYFFKEIGPRPGGLRSRPFQRRWKKPPTPLPGGHPPTLPPGRFFYGNSLRKS